jgi:glycosyltransferase involved in cell wall biosynthesis
MLLLGLVLNRGVERGDEPLDVQIIVPVHDGEAALEDKIRNCLDLDYPEPSRRIRIVSDGSTDATVEIARRFAAQGVECLAIPQRVGKVAAQNRALQGVSAPIVLFTDVSIRVRPDALKLIASNFSDPSVGVVSCRDAVGTDGGAGSGESLYIRYDMLLRRYSNRSGSLIGATGGFYAVREELTRGGWNPAYPPDFYAALRAIDAGLRVVEDERVLAYYSAATESTREMERKVRTITRGMQALFGNARLLNPARHGLAAFKLWNHKLLRWATPVLLAGLLAVNLAIVWQEPTRRFYALALVAQVGFHLAGIVGLSRVGRRAGLRSLLRVPAFTMLSNVALTRSWWNLVRGRQYTVWSPTPRG